MGLGSAEDVTLAEARDKNEAARKLARDGIDPIAHRHTGRKQAMEADQGRVSFAVAAWRYIAANKAGWRNPKHAQQWHNTLATYAEPIIGEMACGEIGTNDVLKVLEPIWREKPATAVRLRGRIEIILSYATVRGWRDGPNPAVWRGHLQMMLPAKNKIAMVRHHAALDWREAPAFMAELRQQTGMAAAALQFAVLTAARSGEARGAWGEIDMGGGLVAARGAHEGQPRPSRAAGPAGARSAGRAGAAARRCCQPNLPRLWPLEWALPRAVHQCVWHGDAPYRARRADRAWLP